MRATYGTVKPADVLDITGTCQLIQYNYPHLREVFTLVYSGNYKIHPEDNATAIFRVKPKQQEVNHD